MVRIKFDVCGVAYSIEKSFLDAGPISNLTKLCASSNAGTPCDVLYINRPPDLFNAILTLYLTGDLHIPMTSCPGAFLKEMEFWEIDPKYLSNCCFYKLQCHQEEQSNLVKFHKQIVDREDDVLVKTIAACSAYATVRARVWSVVDYRSRDVLTKLYFVFALLMILLSIMTISLGTCESFRRNMTNCERLEFMESANMDHIDTFAGLIRDQDCENTTLPYNSRKSRAYHYYDYDDYHHIDIPEQMVAGLMGNVVDTTTQGLDSRSDSVVTIEVPNMKVPIRVLVVLDLLTLVFFTIDFILRLSSCPSILSYFKSIINIADTLALIGTYLHLILLQLYKAERYRDDLMDALALMQVLRSLRLFRLVTNITAARVLAFTFVQNLKDLSILLLFIIVGICTFSSVFYIIEKDERMGTNIPLGWYWALITMTTVGYGDIIPVSIPGRFLSCVCAVTGLFLFALTIPVFANQFVALYKYANLKCFTRLNCKDERTDKPQSGGVPMSGQVIATGQTLETDFSQT